jgi:GNAT superfamily N-acetyltransferase
MVFSLYSLKITPQNHRAMNITIKEVETRKDLKTFVHLPAHINRHDKNWMPPIYSDDWKFFQVEKNKSAEGCEIVKYLAYQDRKPVGRIAGIIHHRYNELHGQKTGRLFAFECYENQEVAHALIDAVEQWAKQKGMNKLIGPLGFSDKDPQGFQIEGFEHPPIYATPCHQPYMNTLIAKEGYIKLIDLNDYIFPIPDEIPPLYRRVIEWAKRKADFQLIEFKSRKEIKPYIIPVFQLMNETYMHILGFIPLDDLEMKEMAARYLPVLNPEFIKLVKVKDELVGFIIAMPEMAPGIRRARGRLFPFGFLHILLEIRRTKHLTLLLGAIKKSYRGIGVDVLIGVHMLEICKKLGMNKIESHLVLETNKTMNGEYEKLGAQIYKRFRIYQKNL